MMFGWRKKKAGVPNPSDNAILAMASPKHIAEVIENSDPASRLMTLVGLVTIWPTIAALKSVLEENGQAFDDERVISELSVGIDNARSEGERRKFHWMLMGFLVLSLEQKSSESELLDIWKNLIDSMTFSKGALQNNVVWSADEKSLFLDSEPRIAASVLISTYAPHQLRKSAILKSLAWSLVSPDAPVNTTN